VARSRSILPFVSSFLGVGWARESAASMPNSATRNGRTTSRDTGDLRGLWDGQAQFNPAHGQCEAASGFGLQEAACGFAGEYGHGFFGAPSLSLGGSAFGGR